MRSHFIKFICLFKENLTLLSLFFDFRVKKNNKYNKKIQVTS